MSELKNKIIAEVKKIYDPEIPVNIYELGLIYNIIVDENNNVKIQQIAKNINGYISIGLSKFAAVTENTIAETVII